MDMFIIKSFLVYQKSWDVATTVHYTFIAATRRKNCITDSLFSQLIIYSLKKIFKGRKSQVDNTKIHH